MTFEIEDRVIIRTGAVAARRLKRFLSGKLAFTEAQPLLDISSLPREVSEGEAGIIVAIHEWRPPMEPTMNYVVRWDDGGDWSILPAEALKFSWER